VTAATAALLVAQAGAALVDTCAISSASPAPHFSANVQGEYNVLFGSNEGYLRGLLNYNGKTRGDDVNPVDSVSSYALINMYAGVRHEDGNWDVGVYVKNLTNTHRVLTRNGTRATSTIANASYVSDYYQISTTAPREFGLSFRVAFGSR
jgi:iron complex outermembrane receptor protein